jgi:uncharacterized damage-inducible protein DinB
MTARKKLILTPAPASTAEVGVLLAVLHEARVRTLSTVARISDLDALPVGHHSAGTLLYHIAAIELDWLYCEVLQTDFPEQDAEWFPHPVRDKEGHLSAVTNEPLERHLARLSWVRGLLDETFLPMSAEDFRRVRVLDDYDVTPEWVLMHLALHEAQHQGQLALLV